MQLAMIQNKIIPLDQVEPALLDRGTFFGDGVYEVLRSYNGKIFALDDHFQRLANSLAAIEITNIDIEQVRQKVLKAFDTAKIPDAIIYFHITRGSQLRSHTFDDSLTPNFFLTITESPDHTEIKTKGISVSTHPDLRWKRCDIKSLNLLPNILARQDAKKKGCAEAILVNNAGFITEGAGSAFFAIVDKTIFTTPLTSNILPSVTRWYILQAALDIEMTIYEKSITPDQAKNANELFIAVTTKDIVPVVKFDNQKIANGSPGKYTKLLIQEFKKLTLL